MVKKNNSTLDILPDCLIHKIFSFQEAAKMSILSKTWLNAWLTHPNLEFKVGNNIKIVDTIMERYRDGKIPIEKFELLDCEGSTHGLTSIDKWIDIALQNGAKDLVIKVASVSLPIFTILAAKSLRELVLESCNTLMPISLSSGFGVASCNSLRKLSLNKVSLDENMFQTLINCCPLIVSFIFEYCLGLEKIELLNLQNIKSVSISTRRNLYVKIRAPTIEHLSYSGYLSNNLDVECPNLKSLDLSYMWTSGKFLQQLTFESLNVLKIQYCGGIAEINSPNLVSFEYTGDQISELKIEFQSRKLKHSKIVLHCYDYLNDAWFCKLRTFLSNSTSSCSQVSLYFPKGEKINMKNLQLHHIVATPEVNVLNVDILCQDEECPTFVDALLRSCHPRRLNLHSSIKMITCFIRRLMYMKNSSLSLSQLVEMEAFDAKKQPLQLRSGELLISNPTERKKVFFLLDWRCN
ncbi:hypothetical protein P3S67_000336 [Capsicum chacoense]